MLPDWKAIRQQFPALEGRTYLNTATYGQMPLRAQAAVERHFSRRVEFACSDFLNWFDDADDIRTDIGRLIGCAGDDIAFLPTASAALSLMLNGIDWKPRDRVVTIEHEFPNNLYGPALLTAQGVEFVETTRERIFEVLNDRTRLVAVSSVNYQTGELAPVQELSDWCASHGATFYLDGTQSVGALRMDVSRIKPAMMAVDAYKWMLTPNGAGFVYVSPETRKWLAPATVGWRSHYDWRAVENLHHGAPQFSDKAERYEGGMLPFAMMYAMGEVVRMMLEIGTETLEQRVLEVAGLVRQTLRDGGAEVSEDATPIVCGLWTDVDAPALASGLKERGVYVSARRGRLRVSPHFYNDEEDVARLGAELAAIRGER
jgi:selenocysteine lyase/cysteine desulfurase